ncbi:TetR/AcrR family transcriptional regulator [Actinoallomurus soli]|uniref:TetR/AcrR family transcriptional regulator n=1 Tax=Actinoallomurus soli TaxID=2952535 RepID=UPI0020937CBB|nr:TetR/AcrR family transcriptional regulator [Actinoallomurus soli]MCO5972410.1 TetR/AcrR family transcriptional regulator [Actinoallomurus soli]
MPSQPAKERSPKEGTRTQRQRRQETERRLLDATATLVAAGGSRAVTLQEVGRLAGYSRGIVNHMFGTKEALLAALVTGAQLRVAPPEASSPGLTRLRQRAARYIDQIAAGDEHARAFLLLWAESIGATPHLRAMFAERDNLFAREIGEDLSAGIADGDIRPDIDTEGITLALIAMLRGVGLHTIIRDAAPEAAARVRETVLAFLQGSLAT